MKLETRVDVGNTLPDAIHKLLPHTAAVLIGCPGCADSVTVHFTGEGCAKAADEAYTAADIVELPVRSFTLQRERSLSGFCDDVTLCEARVQEALSLLENSSTRV